MKILENECLAPYTSLRVGGNAQRLIVPETYEDVRGQLQTEKSPVWFLGFGSNCLISDDGLPGTTIMWREGKVTFEGNTLIADAGMWWDDIVQAAIERNLWGLELMSEIPSSVGGAIYGNIAAYGQQVSDTLQWLEVFDFTTKQIVRLGKDDVTFSYRQSSLQSIQNHYILRAAFSLSTTKLHELKYDAALLVGTELGLDHDTLAHCRQIIIETRRRAGSLYHPEDKNPDRTAGSFFKNPLVSTKQAIELARFDESGATLERIRNQSIVHGGDSHRASAAHVLLAAGFQRGQTWDTVRLHPNHVLKVQTLEGATATEVYTVVMNIIGTVKEKLGIIIEPEVRFLGEFKQGQSA